MRCCNVIVWVQSLAYILLQTLQEIAEVKCLLIAPVMYMMEYKADSNMFAYIVKQQQLICLNLLFDIFQINCIIIYRGSSMTRKLCSFCKL